MRQDLRSCAFCHGRGAMDIRFEDQGLNVEKHTEAVGWTVLRSGEPWVFPRCTEHMIDDWSNSVFMQMTPEEINILEIMWT